MADEFNLLNEEENLKAENEFLKMKMMLEQGAKFGGMSDKDLPPEIENEFLKNTWPYDELYNLTTNVIQDRIITNEEHDALLDFCKALVGDSTESNSALASSLTTGFYQIDPTITVQENTFCITGVSKRYKRREIAEKIELYGGYMADNVSAKLNYLVVCDEKNSCWAFICYGRKIEEAIKHRKQGTKLVIVHEFDLYDTLESL